MDMRSRWFKLARERRTLGARGRLRDVSALVLVSVTVTITAACRASVSPLAPPPSGGERAAVLLPDVPAHAITSCSETTTSSLVVDQLSRQLQASAVALSDDGATLVTTGAGGTSVWDVRSSRRIDVNAAIRGSHVAFGSAVDDAILVDTGGKLWRWDADEWQVIADLWSLGVSGQMLALHWPKGGSAWVVSEGGVHSLALEHPTRVEKTRSTDALAAAAAGANVLAVAHAKGGIELLENGANVIHRIDETGRVRRMALSRDGARVTWSTEDGQVRVHDTTRADAPSTSFTPRTSGPVQGLSFDADGHEVLVAAADGSVTVHEAASGTVLREFAGRPSPFTIDYATATPFAMASDGGFLASLAMDVVRIHEARSLEPLFTLQSRSAFAGELRVSDDGRWLLLGSGSAWVAWDLARLVPTPLLAAAAALGESTASTVVFEDRSSVVIVTDRRIVRVDLKLGSVVETMDLPALAGVVDVSYAAEARSVVRVDASGALDVFVLGERSSQRVRPLPAGVVSAALTPDAAHIVLLGGDGKLVVIPTKTPKDATVLAEGLSPRTKLRLGSDGKSIVHEHRRWDVHTGANLTVSPRFDEGDDPLLASFRAPAVGASSHDGRWHVVGDDDGCVRVVDAASGETKLHARAFDAGTRVASIAASTATGMVFAAAGDGRVRAWNTKTGESVTLAATPGAWAAWRDDGYFAASRLGHELLAFRGSSGAMDALRAAVRLNRPGAMLKRLLPAGERTDSAAFADVLERAAAARLQGSLAPTNLPEPALTSIMNAPPVRARIKAVDRDAAIVDVIVPGAPAQAVSHGGLRVRIDGVHRADLDASIPEDARNVELRVPVPSGVHVIEVSMTSDGLEIGPPAVMSVKSPLPASRGRLLFFGVGASSYADPRIRPLAYADDDVRDLAAFMRLAGASFAGFEAKLLPDGASRAEIDAALAEWTAGARAEDTLVTFFAGHGKHVQGKHVLLTHDSRLDALSDTTLPIRRVHELLDASAALRRVLLIDTCESGDGHALERTALARSIRDAGIDPASARGLELELQPNAENVADDGSTESALAERVARWAEDRDHLVFAEVGSDAGTVTLVSSRGWEPSLEFPSLENGVFSTAVLSTLTSTSSDIDEDGSASIDEIVFVATRAVAALTQELQHPMLLASNPRASLRLPIVGDAAAAGRDDRRPRAGEPVPNDATVRDLVRRWYEERSEFAGVYEMRPIEVRVTLRGDLVVAHVFYRYQSSGTSDSARSRVRAVDKRWFSFSLEPNGTWNVTGMGASMSGLL